MVTNNTRRIDESFPVGEVRISSCLKEREKGWARLREARARVAARWWFYKKSEQTQAQHSPARSSMPATGARCQATGEQDLQGDKENEHTQC